MKTARWTRTAFYLDMLPVDNALSGSFKRGDSATDNSLEREPTPWCSKCLLTSCHSLRMIPSCSSKFITTKQLCSKCPPDHPLLRIYTKALPQYFPGRWKNYKKSFDHIRSFEYLLVQNGVSTKWPWRWTTIHLSTPNFNRKLTTKVCYLRK